MAGNPGDSGNAVATQQGNTSKGFKLPNGTVFRDKGKLVKYLRNNPGFVWKNRNYLKSQLGDTLKLAGYHVAKAGRGMQQYNGVPGSSTKMLRAWVYDPKEADSLATRTRAEGTKIIKVGGRGGTAPVVPTTRRPPGPDPGATTSRTPPNPSGKNTPDDSGDSTAAPSDSNSLLDIAIKRLLGLDAGVGQTIDPSSILAGLAGDTRTQTQLIRSAMKDIESQKTWNTGAIDKWFGQVGESVDRSRTRGAEMTEALGKSLTGSNQAILESIGGSAAMGASPVAQSGQNGLNTLAALGAADQQFLNDMGPLLQGEGASLKAREIGRLGQMTRELQNELRTVTSGDNSKRAELLLQIAQMNNATKQQQFQNRAGLAETLGGLAISDQKLTDAQSKAIMDIMAKQQADETKAGQAQTKLTMGQINQAQDLLLPLEDVIALKWTAKNGLADKNLVQHVRQTYQQSGLDVSDPRVVKAIKGAIESYSQGRVDPSWIRGWVGR